MARVSYIYRIRSRATELEAAIKEMEQELQDLRAAERVIGRLGNEDDDDALESARPPKGKTISDFIADVLAEFGPMDSREILDRVSDRQETTFNTVSTTLSRMKEQGLVVLNGRIWGLINKEAILDDDVLKEAPTEELRDLDTPKL